MCGGYLGNQSSSSSPVCQGGALSSLGSEAAGRVALGEGTQFIMETLIDLFYCIESFQKIYFVFNFL